MNRLLSPYPAAHHRVRPARTDRHHRLVYRTIRTAGDKTRYYRPVMRNDSRGLLFAALLVLVGPRAVGQKTPASRPARDSHDGLLGPAGPWVAAATSKAKFT